VTARLLLGIVAALRAVLIPGQAELMMSQPLSWPRWSLPTPRSRHAPLLALGHRGEPAVDAVAALPQTTS